MCGERDVGDDVDGVTDEKGGSVTKIVTETGDEPGVLC